MKQLRKPVLLILLILTAINIFELKADWYPIVVNYTRSNYNSGPQNWSMIQTPNSWIYFGNNYGMLEFDGVNWVTYPVPNNTCVRSLLQHDNKIFVGAENELGYYTSDHTGKMIFHSLLHLLKPEERYFGNIWKIHKKENALFFQAEKVILKYADNKLTCIYLSEKIEYSNIIYDALWLVTSHHIYYLIGNNLIKLNVPQLSEKQIVSILPYKNKQYLFVSAFQGLYVWNGNEVTPLTTNVESTLRKSQLFCASGNKDFIALGSVQDGLFVLDYSGKLYTQLNVNSGLSNNTILSVFFDFENNLWLGLDDGVSYVALNFPITNLFNTSNYYGKGTASFLKNDIIYLGTNQGLMFDKWPITVGKEPPQLERISGLSGQVWELSEIDGDLFCSHNNGVFHIQGTTGKFIQGTLGTWSCKAFHENQVLAGTFIGFQVLKKENENWKYTHSIKGFEFPVNNFEYDGKYIWKSDREKGIARLTLNETQDSVIAIEYYGKNEGLPSNLYNGVYRLNGEIVFSTENGIYSYDEKKDRMSENVNYDTMLAGKRTYTALKQLKKTDSYWFISDWTVGYSQKNKFNNKYEYDLTTGQYFKQMLFGGFEHINPIDDSCTLVGTEDGFSWMNPTRKFEIEKTPYLSIRNVWVRKEIDSTIFSDNYNQLTYHPEILYTYNSLRFSFHTTEYHHNPDTKYSYKLDNYDDEWSEYTTFTSKEYTKLYEGDYTFRVRSVSNYSQEPVYAEFSFTILPPWYRTKTAYIIYLLLILSSLYLLFRYFSYKWKKSKQRIAHKKDLEIQKQAEEFTRQSEKQEKEILQLKQEKLEDELKLKSSELASTIMIVKNKNEVFSEINDALNTIYSKLKTEEPKKEIRQLQSKINQNKERDDYWEKFEENFDLVYDAFFEKLKKEYPALTTTDRKLCAFLKMNLSSKEIAQLTNISVRSVELSRYRLRKKLDLSRDENLREFLNNY